MTVTRVEVLGAVAASTITPGITSVSSSISGVDLSTFPTGASFPFVVVIDRGTASEEKILITSRSGNTLTVSTRGYDGTSAASHSLGAVIEHCIDALTVDSANKAALNTIGRVTTAGDLLYGTASETISRLGIGTARQQLATNSAATAPEWVASLQSLMTTTGDIVYASAANTPARLAAGTSGYVLTSGGAGVAPSWAAAAGAATFRGARVYRATAQSINTASVTNIAFASESFDTNTLHDTVTNNDRIILDQVGKWRVTGQIAYDTNATGVRGAKLSMNGGATISDGEATPMAAGAVIVPVNDIVAATATTDYLTLGAYQTSGGALDVLGGVELTFLTVEFLGT